MFALPPSNPWSSFLVHQKERRAARNLFLFQRKLWSSFASKVARKRRRRIAGMCSWVFPSLNPPPPEFLFVVFRFTVLITPRCDSLLREIFLPLYPPFQNKKSCQKTKKGRMCNEIMMDGRAVVRLEREKAIFRKNARSSSPPPLRALPPYHYHIHTLCTRIHNE